LFVAASSSENGGSVSGVADLISGVVDKLRRNWFTTSQARSRIPASKNPATKSVRGFKKPSTRSEKVGSDHARTCAAAAVAAAEAAGWVTGSGVLFATVNDEEAIVGCTMGAADTAGVAAATATLLAGV
jgi:hypothetical protein